VLEIESQHRLSVGRSDAARTRNAGVGSLAKKSKHAVNNMDTRIQQREQTASNRSTLSKNSARRLEDEFEPTSENKRKHKSLRLAADG
jgi:hypothetical protein